MKILLTGAAGFIGSHLAKRLVARGDIVYGVDNFNHYYDSNQKWENVSPLINCENFQLLPVDICEFQKRIFSENRFDAVVHLAAMAGVRNSVADPALYFNVNLTASSHLIELARQCSVQNFVFASTSSAYGSSRQVPFCETETCNRPLHPYAASKLAFEQIGHTYHHNYGLNFTALRLFTVYGPQGRPDMMPFLVAKSIHDGTPVPLFEGDFYRDWTFIDDVVDGLVAAVDRPLGYEIINLGRGRPESLRRFIAELETIAGAAANLVPAACPKTEMLITFADNLKAKKLLDFDPVVPVEDGLKQFWDWFAQRSDSSLTETSKQTTIDSDRQPSIAA